MQNPIEVYIQHVQNENTFYFPDPGGERALGVEVEEIRETLQRRELDEDVTNSMGLFAKDTQGALRFEVQGIVDGEAVIEGRPRIEVSLEATAEGGNRAAGGNATAANRLVNAIPWLRAAEPGLYDGLEVPLSPAAGRLGRKNP